MQAQDTPYGYCHCGCGEQTTVAKKTDRASNMVKGEPARYVRGHFTPWRRPGIPYIVENRGYDSPCWVWQRTVIRSGYGMVNRDGRQQLAHRYYYEQQHGEVPDGLHLDHLCRNRSCVNPDHLEPVTNAENCRRGLNTKLTSRDVETIRHLIAGGYVQRSIALRFGVSESLISRIKLGKTWTAV